MTIRALQTFGLTILWVAATFAVLALLGPDWTRYAPATCLGAHCFCEFPRSGDLLLQPANSWSSFGFVAVGSWIMLGAGDNGTAFRGNMARWFGFTAVVIGVGSVLLHATLTLWGQFADVVGMYLLGGFNLVYALRRWRDLPRGTAVAGYVVLCTVLIGLLGIAPETRRWLFAVVLITAIVVELAFARPRRPGVKVSWFALGFAANAVAFGIWILDNTRRLCAPDSLVQGHAAWHLLGAVAVACSYAYFRSEDAPPTTVRGFASSTGNA